MHFDDLIRSAGAEADTASGLVTRVRLRELGASDGQIDHLLRRGRLVPVGRGVMRFPGAGFDAAQRLSAGLLQVPGGAAARRWALWVHGLLADLPRSRPCLVSPVTASVRSGPHLCLHRSRSYDVDQAVEVAGFRVVRVERALIEAWSELSRARWRTCLATAIQRNLTEPGALLLETGLIGKVPGVGAMRDIIERHPASAGRARSTGEIALLAAFARAGLPEPTLNHEVTTAAGVRREIDAAFVDRRLGYELDGRDWHTTPDQVDRDHVRDLELAGIGWSIHRVPARLLRTPRQLERLLRTTFDAHVARS